MSKSPSSNFSQGQGMGGSASVDNLGDLRTSVVRRMNEIIEREPKLAVEALRKMAGFKVRSPLDEE